MATNILLIDLSSIAHPLFHVSASDPNPDATSIKTVERVRALASGQPHVAVCCDSGRSFRRDISDSYKANRPPSDARLQHQIDLAIETLKADGFPVWAVAGFEADDLIATATARLVGWFPEEADKRAGIQIASADKDLLQLVTDRVTIKSLRDGSVVDTDTVIAKFGVRPDQIVDYLSLVGDASDNVKGANGIGEKKAAQLLGKFGTLEDLFAALKTTPSAFSEGLAKALTEFEPRMAEVRSLITLRTDVPLPFEEVFRERVPADTDTQTDIAVFDGGADDAMDATAPSAASPAPAEPAGPEPGVPAAARPVDPMAALAASVRPEIPPVGTTERVKYDVALEAGVRALQPSQGLAVREAEVLPPPSGEFGMQLEPRSLREASLLASELFKSRLFSAYGTWQGVLSTILAGRELGMQAMASLRAFHIIDGKPTMSADLIRALVLKSPQCEYFRNISRDNNGATWETKRKGDPSPTRLTFTIEDGKLAWAKDEKAWKASGWGKNPADMCVARASAKLARLVYADVVFNLYAPEEME